ncbi:PP2C family protein-serine/threonine phosphatase [Streptomyces poriticola]|uniref:PP2C family protein-serine/threonine phosphatase n=1 Tax=Streptomyces poriticola TaxID=3120506 RepID=UPI002FCDEB1B
MRVTLDGRRLEPSDISIRLASGGHPPALILRAGGHADFLPTPGGMLVGALPDARFYTAATTLAPGETLLLYADGLTEARTGPRRDSLYGEDALLEFTTRHAPASAREVIIALTGLLAGFGDSPDAAALLALGVPSARPHPGPATNPPR